MQKSNGKVTSVWDGVGSTKQQHQGKSERQSRKEESH